MEPKQKILNQKGSVIMKKLICILLISFSSLVVADIDGDPIRLSKESIDEAIQKIVYAKDPKTGICYAFLSYISGHWTDPVFFTTVPCEKVGL